MRERNFGLKVVCVLALIALVSWPRFQPIRERERGTIWRAMPLNVRTEASTSLDRRFTYDDSVRSTFDIIDPAVPEGRRSLDEGGLLATSPRPGAELPRQASEETSEGMEVMGRARTTTDESVPYANLVLRNQVTGAVMARGRADESGRFIFKNLPPGKYVLELIDKNGRVASAAPVVPTARSNASGNVRVQQAQATLFVPSTDNVAVNFGATTEPTAPNVVRAASNDNVTVVNTADTGISARR